MVTLYRQSLLCLGSFVMLAGISYAQVSTNDTTGIFTLNKCISFAATHQPALQQSYLDEKISRANNWIGLGGWLPQVGLSGNLQHNIELPTSFVTDQSNPSGPKIPATTGVYNTFNPQINVTQTIYNSDVLYAATAAHLYTEHAKQKTQYTKIALIVDVSKAFYDVLLSQMQIYVLQADTARLNKNVQITYDEFVGGTVDKVDYSQATISLNNAMAQLKIATEALSPKYAVLKQIMGYSSDKALSVSFDTAQIMQEIYADTTEDLDYNKRIEYQQMETSQDLQHALTNYYKYGFFPSIGAYYNNVWLYQNDNYNQLYTQDFRYSYMGINFSFPIFQGLKRVQNTHRAKLLETRLDWDKINLKMQIYTEYDGALARYKASLYSLRKLEENKRLAAEVYNIVQLQYREGIKSYLNVITAESDLKTSEINYLNALFQLLSSKIDLQKAMRDISPNI